METLRGESEYPDSAMAHLRTRLDRDIAPRRLPFILNVLLIEGDAGERRLFGGFSNLRRTAQGRIETMPRFEYLLQELTGHFVFANGSGAAIAIVDQHLELARSQLEIRPRRAHDHMKLLAAINWHVAAKDATVSPACHVAFIPARRPQAGESDNRFGPTSHTYSVRGESAPAVMPVLLAGIDLTPMMLRTQQMLEAMRRGEELPPELDAEEMNRELQRRP